MIDATSGHAPVSAHPDDAPGTDVPRTGARMLLLDPSDRVLLIEEAWTPPEADGVDSIGAFHHWLTPGGGVEPGESLEQAATREVIEETGLRVELADGVEPVHRHRRRWGWAGVTYLQSDTIFAARIGAPFDPKPAALTEMERQTVTSARWWNVEELRATTDTLVPADLPALVAEVIGSAVLTRPQQRTAGRMLVVDRRGRVLMLHSLRSPGGASSNWVTPGGGVEPGEVPAQAAVRELVEETGIIAALAADAEPVAQERAVFAVGSWHLDQTDHYFLHRVDAAPPIDRSRLTDLERETILEYRWWSAAELDRTTDLFWPADLAAVLRSIAGREREPSTWRTGG